MTIAFQSVHVRSVRRLRLSFTEALGSGAFSTSWFTCSCVNARGADPGFSAALEIPTASHQLELALNLDLAPGGRYLLELADGIPLDGGGTSDATSTQFLALAPVAAPSAEVDERRVQDLVFQTDLLHDGNDYVEGVDGDLDTISGPDNAKAAVVRRAVSQGIAWDPEYSPQLREYVDAPAIGLPAARGRIVRHLQMDDRVKQADLRVDDIELTTGNVVVPLDVVLIDGSVDPSLEATLRRA